METMIFVILGLHAVLCLLTVGKVRAAAIPMLILIPVFGPAAVFTLWIPQKERQEDAPLSRQDGGMEAEGAENLISLEDALTVGTTKVRRSLMLDVLNDNTAPYYSLLEEARLCGDVEVVHYAATAMSELNKTYDLMLDSSRKALDAQEPKALENHCRHLESCLDLGLAKGAMEVLRRKEAAHYLQQLCAKAPTEENFCRLIRQELVLGQLADADGFLQQAEDHWPGSEEILLLRLEYFARMGDGKALRKLASGGSPEGSFLSHRAKDVLAFWLKEDVSYVTE